MFRLYEVAESPAVGNRARNVVRRETGFGTVTIAAALLVASGWLIPSQAHAQGTVQALDQTDHEEVSEQLAELSPEDSELKANILENYRVLLLQEGLLLESRQEGAAAGAIEISAGRISVDGEQIEDADLEGLVGDDTAAILRLTELDSEHLHSIFGAPSEAPIEVEESEVAEMWAPETARPSRAPRSSRHRRSMRHSDPKVVLGSGLTVDEDEIVKGDVTVFGGPALIKGEVKGNVVVFANSARIEGGKVHGDVTAIGGSLSLDSDAEIMGSAVSMGGTVERHEDAVIRGDIVEVPFAPNFNFDIWPSIAMSAHKGHLAGFKVSTFRRTMKIMWQIFLVLLIGLLGCLVMLLAPRLLQRVEQKVVQEPWKSGLVGFLGQMLFIPLFVIVLVVLLVSIIGIPLAILWIPMAILGCLLVSFLGYSAVALRIGRWAEQRFGWNLGGPYVALLFGVILINGWAIAGEALSWGWGPLKIISFMFVFMSFILCYATWTIGFGAALLTRFGTADRWSRGGAPVVPPPPAGSSQDDDRSDEVIDVSNDAASIDGVEEVEQVDSD